MIHTLEEIDQLVGSYKSNTSQEALSKLIDAFNAYLYKWVNVVKCKHINVGDSEIGSFVGLFGCNNMTDLRSMLTNTFRYYTDEEIYHELLVLFIYTILQYKKIGGGHFPGYLKSSFKYRVYRWVNDNVKGNMRTAAPEVRSNNDSDYDILLDPDVLPNLSSKEKMILYMRYIDDRSVDDIAKVYGCTAQNINLIMRKAKTKLAEYVK